MISQISDQELINAYIAGQQSALEKIIHRHKSRVFAYILMVVKDKELAEDLFPGHLYKGDQHHQIEAI